MGVKRKTGQEISVYLPYDRINKIDSERGRYFTRSKYILWALDQVLEGRLEKKSTPRGAKVGYQAPSGSGSPNTTQIRRV